MSAQVLNWARKHKYPVCGVAAALLATAGSGAGYVSLRLPREGRMHRDVFLEGKPVGGMTRGDARKILEAEAAAVLHRRVRLTAHGRQWTHTCRQLGTEPQVEEALTRAYRIGRGGSWLDQAKNAVTPYPQGWDIRLRYEFDKAKIDAVLVQIAGQVVVPAKDACAELDGNMVRVEPGQWGESLDVDNSREKLIEAMARPGSVDSVELVLRSHKPGVAYEDLKHLDCVLAEYSTRYRASKVNRSHNLKLAGKCLDKVLLRPDETFSYNDTVGPRLAERGYRPAAIFADGEVVEEIGGGICQVASTCYNVALLSGLKIVQRRPHSRVVDYCPAGRDATVYFGQVDLRFRNTTDLPIYLRTSVAGSRVRVMALGNRSQKVEVQLASSGREVIPHKLVEESDSGLPAGAREEEQKGRDGLRLTYRRVVKRGGRVVADEIVSRDYYKPQARIVRVGTKPAAAPPAKPKDPERAAVDEEPRPADPPPVRRPRIEDLPEG